MTDPLATMRRNLARCGLDPDETIAKMQDPEWRARFNAAWTCFAKPAATGKTCGHVNATGVHHNGNLCCEACGCTKAAGDARKQKESERCSPK